MNGGRYGDLQALVLGSLFVRSSPVERRAPSPASLFRDPVIEYLPLQGARFFALVSKNSMGEFMAAESASARSFNIGSVLSNTFAVMGHNFVTFAVIAALAEIPIVAFSWFLIGLNPFAPAPLAVPPGFSLFTYLGMAGAGGLVAFVFRCILQAALIHGSVADLNGRRASFADCLGTGLKSALPLIVIAILAALGLCVGFVLLIVPAIILSVGWSVIVPVRVVEQKAIFDVFGRSWQLTSGYRWPIFGLFIIVGLGSLALQFVITPLSGLISGSSESAIYMAAAVIVRVVLAMFGATLVGVVYYELRSVKEGIGPEALAAVFD
jgi:hypothetical protein